MSDLVKVEPLVDPAVVENVIVNNDLSKLTPAQRFDFVQGLCKSLNLNILSRPFQYLQLSGKLTLYATKDCTDQLRKMNGISIVITERIVYDDIFVVHAKAITPSGRTDESTGSVPYFKNMTPADKANAMMKAETKAKRRVTLSVCGLGMLDESELDTMGGRVIPVDENMNPAVASDPVEDMKVYLHKIAPSEVAKQDFVSACKAAGKEWRDILMYLMEMTNIETPEAFQSWMNDHVVSKPIEAIASNVEEPKKDEEDSDGSKLFKE